MRSRRVYGPVPSRRFGLSLGIDLVPHKVCSYDCVYCQLGPTTELTLTRRDFYPLPQVLADVQDALARGPQPQVITLAGSGEPTLYASLGELVAGIKALTDIPLLMLTNGSTLHLPAVADALMGVDILEPSLDAGNPETFQRINAAGSLLDFDTMLGGLRAMCARHPQVRLEVMLARGINDSEQDLADLAAIIQTLPLVAIDINTPVRPVPGRAILPCDTPVLERARALFGERATIIARYHGSGATPVQAGDALPRVLNYLARRPGTAGDLATALGLHPHEVSKALTLARDQGQVRQERRGDEDYFLRTA